MARRTVTAAIAAALVLGAVGSAAAQAGGPQIFRDAYTDRFHDDFILDLCGIDTWTTVTERWSYKGYADGREVFQTVRTFVPDDVRIPIEKGAGTGFFWPDGSHAVVGKPIQLFDRNGGVTILDAGRVEFDTDGTVVLARGPHPTLGVDLADLYCP